MHYKVTEHTYIQDRRKGVVEVSARHAQTLDAQPPTEPLTHSICTARIGAAVEHAAAMSDT